MSRRKTERLLNLVLALLSTRRYLTFEQLRIAVPGYEDNDPESARRKFERDKSELRDLGIPLETGSHSVFDDDVGYRIAAREYELPDISLEPDEAAAVGLAARLWAQAGLAGDASRALLKLRAAGVEVEGPQLSGLEPRIEASEPAFEALVEAVTARRPVSFRYRSVTAPEPSQRRLEPWGVVSWHGHWYVVGRDLDREDTRVFRLSRVAGAVRALGADGSVAAPPDIDLQSVVREVVPDLPQRTARLRVRTGAAYDLCRRAARVMPAVDGWQEVELDFRDVATLADEVTGHGAAVIVLEPPDARSAVLRRLRALAGTSR